jgi:valyl-tRNA synthetase
LKIEKEITLINKKLKNVDFIQKAPVNVIDKEKEKMKELVDIRDKIVKNINTIQSK